MEIAVKKGRATRPDIKLGICQQSEEIKSGWLSPLRSDCGEHGGDPDSVKFCHKLGLAYVSCSPYRVPVARLAAAQAAIEEKRAAPAAPPAPAKKGKN
jgi:pyruvate,orthophosphate dikinase